MLKSGQREKNLTRARHNVAIEWKSAGEHVRIEDRVVVRDEDGELAWEDFHAKLAHEHRTGPSCSQVCNVRRH